MPVVPNVRRLIIVLAVVCAGPALADGITGYWRTPVPHHRDSVVQIFKHGDVYDGRIVALEQPDYTADEHAELAGQPKMDIHNPDKAKRRRPLMGLVVLRGLKPKDKTHWSGARIYDPRNGKTYDAEATLSGDGNTLKLRGYVFVSLLGKTQAWTRVDSPDVFKSAGGGS